MPAIIEPDGRVTPITIPDAVRGEALAINDAGQAAGWYETESGKVRAFRADPGEPAVDLGALGGGLTVALAINEAGDVAGYALDMEGREHAFLFTDEAGLRRLGNHGGGMARGDDGLSERWVRLELEVLPPRTPGDLDGDGVVGAADLRRMIAAFGTPEASADLDGDGLVTAADVFTLVANWGAAVE